MDCARLRIAQVAPLHESVPPELYGGTERIVSYLTEELAEFLGRAELARRLDHRADELRERFEREFWSDSIETYVLALDGAKRPCEVRASNAGHCLWTGIASSERGARVARDLMSERSFSGWGIRTLHSDELRYNPISYHNGSVWPHDNAIAAAGMSRYGEKESSARVLSALFDASMFVDRRMPELFCGFRRRSHEGPILYPVACAPQSWAAGAVFLLLQACLGIEIDAIRSRVIVNRPFLPKELDRVVLHGLELGCASLRSLHSTRACRQSSTAARNGSSRTSPRSSRSSSAEPSSRGDSITAPTSCASASNAGSGATRSRPTCSRSTERSARARSERPTPDIACGRASRAPSAGHASRAP
jgi:hypothetical protein